MVYDAVSVHRDRVLSMETFINAIGSAFGSGGSEAGLPVEDLFKNIESLPSITDAVEQLIAAAMDRADGNQTIAARLLGISQPALSKRLSRKEPV